MPQESSRSGAGKAGKEKLKDKRLQFRCTPAHLESLSQIGRRRAADGGNCDLSSMMREALDFWIALEQEAISSSQQSTPIQTYLTKPQRKDIARTVFHEAIALRSFAHEQIRTSLLAFQQETRADRAELHSGTAQALSTIVSSLKKLESRIAALEGYATDFPSQSANAFLPMLSKFEDSLTRIEALSEHIDSRTSTAYSLAGRLEALLEEAKTLVEAARREKPLAENDALPQEIAPTTPHS